MRTACYSNYRMPLLQLHLYSDGKTNVNTENVRLTSGFKAKHFHWKRAHLQWDTVPTSEFVVSVRIPFLDDVRQVRTEQQLARLRIPIDRSTGALTTTYQPDIVFYGNEVPPEFVVDLYKEDGQTPFADATANLLSVVLDFEFAYA